MAKALKICPGLPALSHFDAYGNASFCLDGSTGKLYAIKDGQVYQIPTGAAGGAEWGEIGGTLADQTDLQSALNGKAANDHNHNSAYAALNHNHDGTYAPAEHNHDSAYSAVGHNHDAAYEPKNANIQAHVVSAHAPSNAQKNSDITKGEIEAKLTGEISSHSHAGGGGSPFIAEFSLAADASTGANVTPISLTGFSFAFEANSRYWIETVGTTRAAATTTGGSFQIDVSAAVTRVSIQNVHPLANTGTLSGSYSTADDASTGLSSGRPAANADTPIFGVGQLITGANAGTAQLRYRSEVAAVSTVMAGFMWRVRKLP
jgi:hypothetical protein